jgi:hypothetical protein
MIILAIDPAKPLASRGFATISTLPGPQFVAASTRPDWVVVEGQWVNAVASKQSLMTLSFYAGLLLGVHGGVHGARMAVVPVATWKHVLIPGFSNAPKEVYSRNIAQLLRRHGHPVPRSGHDLDAAGIALACVKLDLTKYEVK